MNRYIESKCRSLIFIVSEIKFTFIVSEIKITFGEGQIYFRFLILKLLLEREMWR